MKTKYSTEMRIYTDCEGRSSAWKMVGEYVDSIEEAYELTKLIPKHNQNSGYNIGDWQIMAKTIDEDAFTVTINKVAEYNWWEEEGKYECHRKSYESYMEEIAELEKAKARCRTAQGLAKREKEIQKLKKLAEEELRLSQR